jgi:hypothetical protein
MSRDRRVLIKGERDSEPGCSGVWPGGCSGETWLRVGARDKPTQLIREARTAKGPTNLGIRTIVSRFAVARHAESERKRVTIGRQGIGPKRVLFGWPLTRL